MSGPHGPGELWFQLLYLLLTTLLELDSPGHSFTWTVDTPLFSKGFDLHIPLGSFNDQSKHRKKLHLLYFNMTLSSKILRKKSTQKEPNLRKAGSCSVYRRLCLWECQDIGTSEGFQECFQP